MMGTDDYLLSQIRDKEEMIRGLREKEHEPSIAAEIRRQEQEIKNLRAEWESRQG